MKTGTEIKKAWREVSEDKKAEFVKRILTLLEETSEKMFEKKEYCMVVPFESEYEFDRAMNQLEIRKWLCDAELDLKMIGKNVYMMPFS